MDIVVDVLGWAGESGPQEGATIDLRVSVHVHPYSANRIGDFSSVEEGFSTRCWTLSILSRNYDNYALDEVACHEGAVAKVPMPAPLPDIPEDVEERFAAAFADATPENAASRVAEAFPDEFYAIEVRELYGEIVAAVGIPSVRKCVLGVRATDGSVSTLRGFEWEQLMPGERGCAPSLYTPAPRDFGPRSGAQGEATALEDGTFQYVVAEGDASVEIQNRFGLISLGQIRNSDGLGVGDNIPIVTGEVLRIVRSP
ncbi:hypothetical protein HDC94_002508 [Leifsonia sp. AK011]|uniref:hypothetical protein n=1 Tax=Leifsonia sp. AK011 TaxID=2723075 RepID=UPI0015CD5E55|nr:hypothetical protein [Leifsonia sp. AK011]NYF11352.1 hypothetical protein [Leifsonia sp. AK011]